MKYVLVSILLITMLTLGAGEMTFEDIEENEDSIAKYSTPVPKYKRIGCFKDTKHRALPDYLGTFAKSIAIQKCAQLAKQRGFTIFSVQFGGQCFTGATASKTYNKYGPAKNCANGLGGTWANDVYSFAGIPRVPKYNRIGCFKDTKHRALPDYLGTFAKSIAIQKCAQLAKQRGFTIFSVQYGGQCFTGATASKTYNKYGPAKNCANGLGGTWANDVYSFAGVPRVPKYKRIGCFKDTKHRALPDYLGTFAKSIAIQKCAQLAKQRGFTIFSVQYGGQCFTGATASKTYNKYGPAKNCANGLGGTWANDVYSFAGIPRVPKYNRIGCFKDTKHRALPDYLGTFAKSIAIQKCAQLAKQRGFAIFSVQYGGQCFTGATASKTYNKYGPAKNCANGLGGTWANDVYSFAGIPRVPKYKRIGCFKDTKHRALPDYLGTFAKSIAIQKCAQLAKQRGFTIFSVQYGGQCFTGATASKTYNKYGPAKNCGNGLGGTWANDVYSFAGVPRVPKYKRIGCFKDTKHRALPDYLGTFAKSIAIQKCAQLAKQRGFTIFSVQYGGQCFTGATASKTYNKYGPAKNCANGLGGTWANDVYSFAGIPRVPKYNRIGCFKDTKHRALPDYLGTFAKSIAIQKCAQLAKQRGFAIFSVQYGGQCFTGATASKTYNKYGPAKNCANGLGGTWANDVYSFAGIPRVPKYNRIGCFKDTKHRALPDYLGTFAKSIAIQKCAQLAKQRGFTIFSVQYGGQCFTGATASKTYNKYGPAKNCANGLGGTWANDVYSFAGIPHVPKYNRIGCFKDTKHRALPDYLGTFAKSIAIQKCAQLAKQRGFTIFSVQYGGQCFTGATASKTYNKYGPAKNCANGLGGTWANDVYSFAGIPRVPEYKRIGCFKDTRHRALPDYLGKFHRSIAIQKCAQLAKQRGFSTFSVQYGGYCFTGSTASDTYDKYGPANNCANGLGGSWANDVYSIPVLDYEHIGCFKDTRNRALPDHLGTFAKSIAIQKCAQLAKQKGFHTFSVQYGGQCFSGANACSTYDKYGQAANCAKGLGGTWANDVYSLE